MPRNTVVETRGKANGCFGRFHERLSGVECAQRSDGREFIVIIRGERWR
jgi:hypothetical protein